MFTAPGDQLMKKMKIKSKQYAQGLNSLGTFILVVLFVLFFISGCNGSSKEIDWLPTKSDAIDVGIKKESISRGQILNIWEMIDGSIVFFEKSHSLGIAALNHSPHGWRWYRTKPYLDYKSDNSKLMATVHDIETLEGSKVRVWCGKVFSPKIKQVILETDQGTFNAKIATSNNSTFWFHVFKTSPGHVDVKGFSGDGRRLY